MFNFKIQKDSRGLTLVELICAIAILSIITATVGGAMVVATNSYRQGTVESALQQEAQFTANAIESLIIDVTKSVEWNSTTNTMSIKNDDSNFYLITFNEGSHQLMYTQTVNGVMSPAELLADHVSGFTVDASDFKFSRNVHLTISMENEGSKYTTVYNVTSRNNPNEGNSSLSMSATINCDKEIVLEPGQEYLLPVTISGTSTEFTVVEPKFQQNAPVSSVAVSSAKDGALISIDKGEMNKTLTFTIQTIAKKPDTGAPLDECVVTVYIRRVVNIPEPVLVGNVDTSNSGGNPYKAGAEYTITVWNTESDVSEDDIYNWKQKVGFITDLDYVNPVQLKWEIAPEGVGYVSMASDWDSRHNRTLKFTLLQDITSTRKVIRVVALHPNGTDTGKDGNPYLTNKGIGDSIPKSPNPYVSSNVENYYTIKVTKKSDATILRGKTGTLPWTDKDESTGIYPTVEEWVRDQTGDPTLQISEMRFYRRYRDSLNDDKTEGYDTGTWLKNQEGGRHGGTEGTKIRPDDFRPVYFTRSYKLQVYLAVQFTNGQFWPADFASHYNYFPDKMEGIHPSESIDPSEIYIREYEIPAMTVAFVDVYTNAVTGRYTEVWWPAYSRTELPDIPAQKLDLAAYASSVDPETGEILGLGTMSKPVPMTKSNPWYFKADTKADYVSDGVGVRSLVSNARYCYDVTNGDSSDLSSLPKVGGEAPGWAFEDGDADPGLYGSNDNYAIFRMKETWNGGYQTGHIYKLVLDEFTGDKGEEHYHDSSDPYKGVIYFKLMD